MVVLDPSREPFQGSRNLNEGTPQQPGIHHIEFRVVHNVRGIEGMLVEK
jgi:hypothetical protein